MPPFSPPCFPWMGLWTPWPPPGPPPGPPRAPLGPIWLPPWTPLIRPCWLAPFGSFQAIFQNSHYGENTTKHTGVLMILGAPKLNKWPLWKKSGSLGPPRDPPRVNGFPQMGPEDPPRKCRAPPGGAQAPPGAPKFRAKRTQDSPPGSML